MIYSSVLWEHNFVHQQIEPKYAQLQNQGVELTKEVIF